jgi:hypothetical protein
MAKTAVKKQVKARKAPDKRLEKVQAEYIFWCHDGSVYSDLFELAKGLAAMSDETFTYHSNEEKHDFSNWIRDVIGDEDLADELLHAEGKLQATDCVVARIDVLA